MFTQLLFLFAVGIVEEFTNLLYYKTGAKSYKVACCFFSLMRTYIFVYLVQSFATELGKNFLIVTIYGLGGAFGIYWCLTFESYLEKYVLKIRRRGRQKKRLFLLFNGKKRS